MFSGRIFVEGLPADMSNDEIAERFSLAGTVERINMIKN